MANGIRSRQRKAFTKLVEEAVKINEKLDARCFEVVYNSVQTKQVTGNETINNNSLTPVDGAAEEAHSPEGDPVVMELAARLNELMVILPVDPGQIDTSKWDQEEAFLCTSVSAAADPFDGVVGSWDDSSDNPFPSDFPTPAPNQWADDICNHWSKEPDDFNWATSDSTVEPELDIPQLDSDSANSSSDDDAPEEGALPYNNDDKNMVIKVAFGNSDDSPSADYDETPKEASVYDDHPNFQSIDADAVPDRPNFGITEVERDRLDRYARKVKWALENVNWLKRAEWEMEDMRYRTWRRWANDKRAIVLAEAGLSPPRRPSNVSREELVKCSSPSPLRNEYKSGEDLVWLDRSMKLNRCRMEESKEVQALEMARANEHEQAEKQSSTKK